MPGVTVWLTGRPAAGKTTIAKLVAASLLSRGERVEVLDGDVVRETLSSDLGFSPADRERNVLRVGFVCELLTRNGIVAIAALVSPQRGARDEVRRRSTRFVEVYVECPLEVAAKRDPKGLYARALAGEVQDFTGISASYEPPLSPELVVRTDKQSADASAQLVLGYLERHRVIALRPESSPKA